MRWLMLFALLLVGPGRGEEAGAPGVKEKLRARIRETLPVPLPGRTAPGGMEPADPMLVLEPMVISESKGLRALGQELATQKQRQEAEDFSLLKGGTIYRGERLELGGWWSPESGWRFLKLKW